MMISLWILADGSQGKTLASAKARTQPEVGTEGARSPVIWGWRQVPPSLVLAGVALIQKFPKSQNRNEDFGMDPG